MSHLSSEASSYDGLGTAYTDHYFTAEVPFAPEGYREEQPQKTTYFEWEAAPTIAEKPFEEVLHHVRRLLPDLAADLIVGHQDMSNPANASFARHPDDRTSFAFVAPARYFDAFGKVQRKPYRRRACPTGEVGD